MSILKSLFFFSSRIYNCISFCFHSVKVGKGVAVNGRLRLYGKGALVLGDFVRINSNYRMNPIGGNTFSSIYIKNGAAVEIGERTGMSNVAIYAAEKITIGRRVKLGGSVKIYDTDFHSVNFTERAMEVDPGIKTAPVFIGDDVFIGANCTILKGVTIGLRSVIGAGYVVTKNIPPDEVWAGVPAKFIRKIPQTRE